MSAQTLSTECNAEPDGLEAWVIENSGWLALGIIAVAFAIRLAYARSCYLNPDEAEHFGAARPASWIETYKAALLLAHPPLFILVLHRILFLGRSELILRSPSLVGGTAALGLAFSWIRRGFGGIAGLAGLGFMALSPAAITASTEVRQYGLLLFFVCGALYATERTLSERSNQWAIIQGLFLLGALLTNYTTIVVLGSLGLYLLCRVHQGGVPRRVLLTILMSQVVLLSVLLGLYFGQIRRANVFRPGGSLEYLRHYFFVKGHETPVEFVGRALFGTFHYVAGLRSLAFLFMFVFAAGIAALWLGRTKAPSLVSLLLISPFIVGFVAAAFRVFPFAGSRHQTYLLPFLAAGISASLAWLPRGWAVWLLLLGAFMAPLWVIHSAPENDARILPLRDMTAAIDYLGRMVPRGQPLFADDMTRDVLRYYLARNDRTMDTLRAEEGGEEWLGGYRIVIPKPALHLTFRPAEVIAEVTDSARALGVPPDDPLWVASAAWKEPSLASRLPAGQDHEVREFGQISVIEILPKKQQR